MKKKDLAKATLEAQLITIGVNKETIHHYNINI